MQGNGFIDGFFGVHAGGKPFHGANWNPRIHFIMLTES
jgi:hypothetical protein